MPLQATSGAASYDAFGGGVPVVPAYIEEVFSTYLYTGNAGSQNIVNGVNLSTYGGMVWIKDRSQATSHYLQDTANGANNFLRTDKTEPLGTLALNTVFNTNGFSQNNSFLAFNGSGDNYVSWTFREQPKFFDVVTYTGTSSAQNIAHNLGSTPACIIVKKLNDASIWPVYHASLGGADKYLTLNTTDASDSAPSLWNNTAPTSTQFTVGTSGSTNGSGNTFVAYLFASNAGGFGLTGTDNVISCGSYTGNGSFPNTITLGYEPQWVMIKKATSPSGINTGWVVFDNMRGLGVVASAPSPFLYANTSGAEDSANYIGVTATGFQTSTQNIINTSGDTYIYIAIRRGPMKVPTVGTSVFSPQIWSGDGTSNRVITGANFAPDMAMLKGRSGSGANYDWLLNDRLRGNAYLITTQTASENSSALFGFIQLNMNGGTLGSNTTAYQNVSGQTFAGWFFGRAPGFFDEVCYTGTGSNRTVTHNLGVAPELMIVKCRNEAGWNGAVYASGSAGTLLLDQTSAAYTSGYYAGCFTSTSATTFGVNTIGEVNKSANTYVAYLFATCAGVSKVFSFTGTGSLQTINCGFTSGARFVLVKRTDSTGDWYVWDSARGISSSTDPYLLLNSTAAEVTSTNWVDTTSTGFQVTAASGNNVNINGATYIGLAIA
jgi:hypothetical protein